MNFISSSYNMYHNSIDITAFDSYTRGEKNCPQV